MLRAQRLDRCKDGQDKKHECDEKPFHLGRHGDLLLVSLDFFCHVSYHKRRRMESAIAGCGDTEDQQ